MSNSNTAPNRLINEKSPYLLQHAYNPVDWYPWGDEAFEKAKTEDKPIFLSIGYSTCHWCHVMENESFEDVEVAAALNNDFVCVKVDKEERPDIDSIYMRVCQGLTGSGGWPLTIIMSPEAIPFYAATYLPKHDRYGIRGILSILEAVQFAWKNSKDALLESGNRVLAVLKKETLSHGAYVGQLQEEFADVLKQAAEAFIPMFDKKNGGFGGRPKFPSPQNLMLLMRYYDLTGDGRFLHVAEKTLIQMYRGGFFDHLGGGFSRYSTDERWLAPHFEKMLYDNALLAVCYAEAFALTKKEIYKRVCSSILEYLAAEMSSEEGGFYSAQDADSEGEEGKYYVFSIKEIHDLLGDDAVYFCNQYGISNEGNFEGKNILNLLDNDSFEDLLDDERAQRCRQKILEYRKGRMKLHKDEKQLASWNAMAIAAFAKAGRLLEKGEYIERAEKGARFIEKHLLTEDGGMHVRVMDREAGGIGHLDDYAFYGWALAELYDATVNDGYLDKAVAVFQQIQNRFADGLKGFFLTDKNGEKLISRPKEIYDGAVPSGNSAAAFFFARLSKQTRLPEVEKAAKKQIEFMCGATRGFPEACPFAMLGLMTIYSNKSYLCENGACSI